MQKHLRPSLISTILIPWITAVPVLAQSRYVTPGDPSVSGDRIVAYANEWSVVSIASDGSSTGTGRWLDSLDVVTIEGVEHLRRVQRSYDANGSLDNRQVHLVERATLRPLRSHTAAGDAVFHAEFETGRVSGFIVTDPEAKSIQYESEVTPAFDFSSPGILLSAMALKSGETVSLPNYALEPTAMGADGRPSKMSVNVEDVVVQVRGPDRVSAGRLGERDALRVEVPQGARTLTFWLVEDAPYIVRLTVETPAGVTIWEMLTPTR